MYMSSTSYVFDFELELILNSSNALLSSSTTRASMPPPAACVRKERARDGWGGAPAGEGDGRGRGTSTSASRLRARRARPPCADPLARMATSGSPCAAPSTATTVTQMEGDFASSRRAPPELRSPPVGKSRDTAHPRLGNSGLTPGEEGRTGVGGVGLATERSTGDAPRGGAWERRGRRRTKVGSTEKMRKSERRGRMKREKK
jgi:hypothetical protein